ncbi:aspartate/glutamate racemase family protein [Allorhizobium pseudoryzae]|uniref:aspartate/glutamate racemase family protein n=1 Tax=Allorhizobium pseudoryzae TaxID=379684 RepID=UPI003CFCB3A8
MSIYLFNPNTNADTTKAMAELASAEGLRVTGRTAPFGVPMIVAPASLAQSADAVVAMFDELLDAGAPIQGIIIAAFGDPGLAQVRAKATLRDRAIPVCGIGEASFIEAGAEGRRFAVATTTPALEGAIRSAVDASGMSANFLGSFFTKADPFAAVRDPAWLVELLAEVVLEAKAAGAEAVIIGGGPLAKAASKLVGKQDLVIIEPVPAAARLMARRIARGA